MIEFFIGLFLGGFIGVMVLSLFAVNNGYEKGWCDGIEWEQQRRHSD